MSAQSEARAVYESPGYRRVKLELEGELLARFRSTPAIEVDRLVEIKRMLDALDQLDSLLAEWSA